jgi:hypothetical protein
MNCRLPTAFSDEEGGNGAFHQRRPNCIDRVASDDEQQTNALSTSITNTELVSRSTVTQAWLPNPTPAGQMIKQLHLNNSFLI